MIKACGPLILKYSTSEINKIVFCSWNYCHYSFQHSDLYSLHFISLQFTQTEQYLKKIDISIYEVCVGNNSVLIKNMVHDISSTNTSFSGTKNQETLDRY